MTMSEVAFAALGAALRWSVPFAVAWVILRRTNLSAAARHQAWTLLLAGLLLLPVGIAVLPSVGVPRPAMLEPAPAVVARTPGEVTQSTVRTERERSETEERHGAVVSPGVGPAPSAITPAMAADRRSDPVGRLAAAWPWLWAGGALALSGFWAIGQIVLRRITVRGRPGPRRQMALLRACTRRLKIRRPVHLLHSDEESVPMTWGWLRPVVLLPAGSRAWSDERLQRVLLHELAHVARFDSFFQVLARGTCCLFWFHPAVWLAARHLRREAEMACDDVVVDLEGTPVAYAEDLLRIARLQSPLPLFAPALPMAGRSGLGQRVRAILEPSRRRGVSRVLAGAIALSAVTVVGTAAVIRWAESPGFARDNVLHSVSLGDGRQAWTFDCGGTGEAICIDGGRRAVALLEQTGRTGAVVAQQVGTGEIVVFAAVRDPRSDQSQVMPSVAPGSVAKLALAALWWENGWADSLVSCPAETRLPSGRPVRNAGGYASSPVTAERMLVVSCNTAAVAMAARLVERHGEREFGRALDRTGLTASKPWSLSAPGHQIFPYAGTTPQTAAYAAGLPPSTADENDLILLATLGSGSTTTPLEVSRFLQAVGNGGRQLPAVPLGETKNQSESRFVVGPGAATRLQHAMRQVVREGTAARALPQLEWSRWSLGGKTGTVPNGADGMDGWFAGLAYGPEGEAEYTIVVLVEGGGVGGGIPAGIAAEMTRLFARVRGDEL
jgi:beta-lactamase regulating signal transducer with metallopeptidase domain